MADKEQKGAETVDVEALKAELAAAKEAAAKAEERAEAAEKAAKAKAPAAAGPAPKKHKLTKADSHVATARGYASGVIIEPGEQVPEGIPVSNEWMAEGQAAQAAE